ncbi:MAG: hypothetical protein JKY09_00800 [Crocinitomicaceae bacterium]|nr:hypothetical protein [Crocinitomicaceae bacterium]
MFFPQFKPSSKVWVYTANRSLRPNEVEAIEVALKEFIPKWAAHGDTLYGDAIVHANRFVILSIDESLVSASGCSIDTSVRFIKQLGTDLNIDFFDRMNLVVNTNDELKSVHISTLKDHLNEKVYNPMITNLQELREEWLISVALSPFV